MIVCSCLNIKTKDIEELVDKSVDLKCIDVYNYFKSKKEHSPCTGCPSYIKQVIRELEVRRDR